MGALDFNIFILIFVYNLLAEIKSLSIGTQDVQYYVVLYAGTVGTGKPIEQ